VKTLHQCKHNFVVAIASILVSIGLAACATDPSTSKSDGDKPQPVSGACRVQASASVSSCNLYTVPAGKRLVVEMFSYQLVSSGPVGRPLRVVFGQSTGGTFAPDLWLPVSNVFVVPPVFSGNEGGISGFDLWTDTRMTRFYLEEGTTFAANIFFDGNNATSPQVFMFSGYLLNK
jgi:hypothetical protein